MNNRMVSRVRLHDVDFYTEMMGGGPPLLLLHGFTGVAADWRFLCEGLTDTFTTVCVDLLGHGQSTAPRDAKRYSMQRTINDMCALMQHFGYSEFGCLGYSMGGRIALSIACEIPTRIKALVLESTSPGIKTEALRAERILHDEALAKAIDEGGIEAFVDKWEGLDLFLSQRGLPPDVKYRVRQRRLAQRAYGLSQSLRGIGTGMQPSRWGELCKLSMPVLLITGTKDEKYNRIAKEMQGVMPDADWRVIEDAGHTVHLEQPAEYLALVQSFLTKTYFAR